MKYTTMNKLNTHTHTKVYLSLNSNLNKNSIKCFTFFYAIKCYVYCPISYWSSLFFIEFNIPRILISIFSVFFSVCRLLRIGSSFQWFWIDSSYGYLHYPVLVEHWELYLNHHHCTILVLLLINCWVNVKLILCCPKTLFVLIWTKLENIIVSYFQYHM